MAYFSSTKIQERHPIWGSLHLHRGPKKGGELSFTRRMIAGHQTNLCIFIFFYYRNHSCDIWNPPLQIIRKIIPYTRKLNVGKITHQHEVKSIQGDAMQPFTDICLEAALSGRGTYGMGQRRTKGMGSAASSASTTAASCLGFLTWDSIRNYSLWWRCHWYMRNTGWPLPNIWETLAPVVGLQTDVYIRSPCLWNTQMWNQRLRCERPRMPALGIMGNIFFFSRLLIMLLSVSWGTGKRRKALSHAESPTLD